MWDEIHQFRWLRLIREPNSRSRMQLRLFGAQIAIITALCMPALVFNPGQPLMFLSIMHLIFASCALLAVGAALVSSEAVSRNKFCLWDNAFAMIILMLFSSAALRLIGG